MNIDSLKSGKVIYLPLFLAVAAALAWIISTFQLIGIAALIVLPFILAGLWVLFSKPHSGLIMIMILSFVITGLGRYVNAPFSLLNDGLLAGAFIAGLFQSKAEDFARVGNFLVLAMGIWTFYTVMEIFNPEALGIVPWFLAVRSVSLYLFLIIILTLLIFKTEKLFDLFLLIWCVGGIISALYGMKQKFIGLDSAEMKWLYTEGRTHLIWGKLRIFSFYSDAGQYGAFMAFTSLMAFILAVKTESVKKRIFFVLTGFITAYGMLISGTRGALFVFVGALIYLLLDKNFKTLIAGLLVVGSVFFLLKYTHIGAGNYDIQRLRSAVTPSDDPSFQVRLENQKKFAEYLDTRPFGGGIGSSGYWGNRFRPGSFLGTTPTDSWYVRIWAETGIVGLIIHIGSFVAVLLVGAIRIWNIRDQFLKQKLMAVFSGCFGIMVSSYGNQLIGQFPTIVYFSMSLAFIFLGTGWDKRSPLLEYEEYSQQHENKTDNIIPR